MATPTGVIIPWQWVVLSAKASTRNAAAGGESSTSRAATAYTSLVHRLYTECGLNRRVFATICAPARPWSLA